MTKIDIQISKEYSTISEQVAKLAFDYNKTIENSIHSTGKVPKIMSQIFFYPSRFMLRFNAVKRIESLCSNLLLNAVASEYDLDGNIISTNNELKSAFCSCHEKSEFITLVFAVGSSSLFLPILAYIANMFYSFGFNQTWFITFSVFILVFVLLYNYLKYDELRGELKNRYENLRDKIKVLK